MNITYGNREGQYFTEWRFDVLKNGKSWVVLKSNPDNFDWSR